MLVSIGTFSLCDGTRSGGVGVTRLRFRVRRKLQVAEWFRAEEIETFDRGNRETMSTFEISRTFPDLGTADAFVLTHEESIPSGVYASFVATLTNGQKVMRYLPNANMQDVELVEQIGVTTRHRYTLLGGIVTSINPNLWGAAQI